MKIVSFLGYAILLLLSGALLFTSCDKDDEGADNVACFNHTQSQGTVNFDAGCSKNAVSYEWNFGNGDEVSQIVPTFSYAYPDGGTYTVTLLVTFSDGAKLTTTRQVVIEEICLRCGCFGPQVGASFIVECGTNQALLQQLCSPLCSSMSDGVNICTCSYE